MTFRKLSLLLCSLLPWAGCGATKAPEASFVSFPGHDPRLLWDTAGRLSVVSVEVPAAAGPEAVVFRRLGTDPVGPVRVSPPGLEIAANRESPPTLDQLPDGALVVAYSVKRPGRWSSELRAQRSTDGGRSWGEPRLLHPSGEGAHSFLSSATSAAGTLAFTWLDKSSGEMGLHSASTRDGSAFTPPASLDARTCQCCGTAMAAGPKGELWAVYRDLEGDDVRDFRVLRSTSEPPAFQEGPKLSSDGWHIRGCPETGARLAAAPDGVLWAAWFTGGGEPGVYASSSRDGGARFAPRTLLTPPGQPGLHPEIGVLADGRVAVLYETTGDLSALQARVRDSRGVWAKPWTVAPGGTYPRLATRAGRTAVAFTCRSAQAPRVVVADWRTLEEHGGRFSPCASR
jgi:hypothetical protein